MSLPYARHIAERVRPPGGAGSWRGGGGGGGGSRQDAMLHRALLRRDDPQPDPSSRGAGDGASTGSHNGLGAAHPAELPDTGLKGHSLTCLTHW